MPETLDAKPIEADPAAARPGAPAESGSHGLMAAATAATFGGLSALRRARIFHPDGVGYRGVLSVDASQPAYAGVPLLERPAEYQAVCRLSRGGGLPYPLPDVLGLAVRLPNVHGPERHQDFLLATSAEGALLQHLLLPGVRGFLGQSFSSVLPYRIGNQIRLVGAQPAARRRSRPRGTLAEVTAAATRGDLRFRLALAPLRGGWTPFAELVFDRRLRDDETERLAFTPWNTGGGIRPVGPLQGLRQPAYRGSQRGRGLRADEIP